MKLYHYTSVYQLGLIMQSREIRLSPSNLMRPKNPRLVDIDGIQTFIDETDTIKPVVWLTTFLDFDRAVECGVSEGKTECAIVIDDADKNVFKKWDKWAIANGIEKAWFNTLKQTAPLWRSFYVSEQPIVIPEKGIPVLFRPDVAEKLDLANWRKNGA